MLIVPGFKQVVDAFCVCRLYNIAVIQMHSCAKNLLGVQRMLEDTSNWSTIVF